MVGMARRGRPPLPPSSSLTSTLCPNPPTRQNVKLALRKMFRGGKGHERLLEDPMDADLQQQPSHTQ